MGDERRAPVQASKEWYLHQLHQLTRITLRHGSPRVWPRGPGSVAWSEHLEAWYAYVAERYGHQGPEKIAALGGFSIEELREFLGREPTTWRRS